MTKKLGEVWGELGEASANKQQAIAKWKAGLTPATLARADKSQGRIVFNALCAACHTLYGEGGKAGPDLTGGGRDNLDYLLENIVDPSAVVTADFRMSIVELKDGRVLAGMLAAEAANSVTLVGLDGAEQTILRSELRSLVSTTRSLMPDGLEAAINEQAMADLIAFLGGAPAPKN